MIVCDQLDMNYHDLDENIFMANMKDQIKMACIQIQSGSSGPRKYFRE